jgi:2-polyprenyl-6-methoxyphenol hydroxylase-like FAD-dependent oxidoreductase
MPRALVIGGGVAGPATAMFLAADGWEVEIMEAAAKPDDYAGAFLNVATNGLTVLDAIGLRERLLSDAHPAPHMIMWSSTGKQLGSVPNGPAGDPARGSAVVRRGWLHRVLREGAEDRGIPVRFGARLTGITAEPDAVHATFADGREASADILIGCDGIGSPTRTHIDEHAPSPRYSGLVGLGGFARVIGLPPTPATQHFVFGRRSFFGYLVRAAASVGNRAPAHEGGASGGVLSLGATTTPADSPRDARAALNTAASVGNRAPAHGGGASGGVFSLGATTTAADSPRDARAALNTAASTSGDGTVYWFANITAPEPSRGSLRDVSVADWLDRLRDLHRDDPYPVPQIIDGHYGDLGAYPIYDLSGVPRWSRGRVVAVGDAVHATSPSAGQGASLALEDAQALAMCLREEVDHKAAFARYQTMRQPRADKVVDYARKINSQKRVSKSRVAVAIRDAMLPLFLKRAANDQSNDWLYNYRLTEGHPLGQSR